ncbi:DUF4274 domain-containing protein [Gymnodinialimonas hymeniacidonis]|uniref:DUF4274 domain-containing protein n=1 Tax=Gymnodinialimonas hymeniacidonis TaxID=3126508 RepID=UPI0034C659C9
MKKSTSTGGRERQRASLKTAYRLGLQDLDSDKDVLGGGKTRLYFVLPLLVAREVAWKDEQTNLLILPWEEVDGIARTSLAGTLARMAPDRLLSKQKGLNSWEAALRRAAKKEKVAMSETLLQLPDIAQSGVPRRVVSSELFPHGLSRKELWNGRSGTEYMWLGTWVNGEQEELERRRSGRPKPIRVPQNSQLAHVIETKEDLVDFLRKSNDPEFWHNFVSDANYDLEETLAALEWIVEQSHCDGGTLCLMFNRLSGVDVLAEQGSDLPKGMQREARIVERVVQRARDRRSISQELYCPPYFESHETPQKTSAPEWLVAGNAAGRAPRTDLFIEEDLVFRRSVD